MNKNIAVLITKDAYQNQIKNIYAGVGICIFVIGLYNLLFFNRYFPMSEGWFSVIADRILKGEVPYRDFHLFIPPLYPLVLAKFIQLFGENFLALRLFGIVIILSMTIVLFFLFVRVFPLYIATATTILSIIYYQSNVAHITYDFLQFMTLFALISTYCLCKFYEVKNVSGSAKSMIYLFVSGFFGACAFLMKQSNGLVIVIFLLVALFYCLYTENIEKTMVAPLLVFLIGMMLPLFTTFMWLSQEGVLSLFIKQVFIGASESKGSILAIAFGWIPRLFAIENLKALFKFSFVCFLLGYMNIFSGEHAKDEIKQYSMENRKIYILFWIILSLSLLAVISPYWNIALSKKIINARLLQWFYYRVFIVIPTIITFILFALFVHKILTKKGINQDLFILTTMAIGFALGTATSAAVADAGMILALGLLFGLFMYKNSFFQLGRILCFLLFPIMIFFMVSKKYTEPYYWWSLVQGDIRNAVYSSDIKHLSGFRLQKETADIYSGIVSTVEKYSNPGDSIYTFPNMPFFYMLTDRYPRTFALVNWFDVLPDDLAKDEANKLLQSPPRIIIWLDMPDFVWLEHEKAFRGGQQSGQRKIAEVVDRLTIKENKYILEKSYQVPDNCILKIWRWRTT